jgi:hypothetical protein
MTAKAAFAVALAVVGALAILVHLYAPDLMHYFGHMLHGGR